MLAKAKNGAANGSQPKLCGMFRAFQRLKNSSSKTEMAIMYSAVDSIETHVSTKSHRADARSTRSTFHIGVSL